MARLLLALLCLLAPPALAETPREARARAAEAERIAAEARERRAAAEAEAARLAEARVAGAARVQATERELLATARRAEAARAAERAARAEAEALTRRIAPLLPVLARVATQPAPLLLAAPLPPEEVALGLAAMRAMVREAQLLAEALREAEARALREAAEALREAARLRLAEAAAREAAAALDAQLEAAHGRAAQYGAAERAAAARAEEAMARARSLEEALARLEQEEARARARAEAAERRAARRPARGRAPEPPAPAGTPAAAALGPGPPPVVGEVVRGFASPGEGGPARGVTLAAAPGARVVAPCAGLVAFAAPFRSYGRLVILECAPGQHLVLGGLERLDVQAGQRLRAGEPVGVLGQGPRPTLYVEWRRGGEPVDPRPLLRM
ncbi:murein hydrolase activator EnvC family protein [Rubritepida flocculans]|uniref:murein hydrolase activator EnvC family protein n=1 Tax=Rubritepida flocculans TaxID=182403 RepID=UPI0003FD3136|nr:peptidoglycan DD-metalloendopeptidase family protein [Rubritepida flocculans]